MNDHIDLDLLMAQVNLLAMAQRDGVTLKGQGQEKAGPCPGCGGRDRFHVFPDRRRGGEAWKCYQCHDHPDDAIGYLQWFHRMSFEQALAELRTGATVWTVPQPKEIKHEAPPGHPPTEDTLQRATVKLLNNHAVREWLLQRYGLDECAIEIHRLGYVENHWGTRGPGVLIPITVDGVTVTGRVRAFDAEKQGWRYLPWSLNCGAWPWGLDVLCVADEAILVEGEFKAMTVSRVLPTIGIPGVDNFMPSTVAYLNGTRAAFEEQWYERFAHLKTLYVALDRGIDPLWRSEKRKGEAPKRMPRTWVHRLIEKGVNVRLVHLGGWKPDDLINHGEDGLNSFRDAMAQAMPAKFALGSGGKENRK